MLKQTWEEIENMNKIVEFLIENISANKSSQISSLVNSPKHLRKKKATSLKQTIPEDKKIRNICKLVLWAQHDLNRKLDKNHAKK